MLRIFVLSTVSLIILCKSDKLLEIDLLKNENPTLPHVVVEQTSSSKIDTRTGMGMESSEPSTVEATQSRSNSSAALADLTQVSVRTSSSPPSLPSSPIIPNSTTTPSTLSNTTSSSTASQSSSELTRTTVTWEVRKDSEAVPYFLRDYVMKRAVPAGTYKNGIIPGSMIPTLASQKGVKHPYAVQAFNRPLYHGDTSSKWEYVGLWWSNGGRAVWGKLVMDDNGGVEGYFVLNNVVRNTSERNVFSATRFLIYEGSPEENNFSFAWVQSRLLDLTTVVSVTNGCPQYAPAVYTDTHENYEFLGEADVVNKKFYYLQSAKPHQLSTREYLRDVYVLTKQRCSCSCDQTIVGSSFR